jgi:hypothetical protein
MSAAELYRFEKARHFANLAPVFAEIRRQLGLDVAPIQLVRHRVRDSRASDAAYYAKHRQRIRERQQERRAAAKWARRD